MAVYTALAPEEIEAALQPFGLGLLVRVEPVAAGIENTTYFVTFDSAQDQHAEYVLTLGESIAEKDMEFVARLTTTLRQHGLPVPAPVATEEGTSIVRLAHKPTLLIPKAPGSPPLEPSVEQCRAIGRALAELHRVTLPLTMTHTSHKSLAWVADTGRTLLPHLPWDAGQLLHSSLIRLDRFASTHTTLPRAIIHGDLFRDNALFTGEQLTAIIDFFSAGNGYLLFDLAVAANDWCIAADCQFIPKKLDALLAGYDSVRPRTVAERDCWDEMLAIAAVRFWVSRLADRILPALARRGPTKDPQPYQALLAYHLSRIANRIRPQ
jgi:homoserine kinase type II